MPKLQRKAQEHTDLQETVAVAPKPVTVASDMHTGVASPARDLMAQLNYELTTDVSVSEFEVDKYPLKWTVISLTLFCGLSWYGLLTLIF